MWCKKAGARLPSNHHVAQALTTMAKPPARIYTNTMLTNTNTNTLLANTNQYQYPAGKLKLHG